MHGSFIKPTYEVQLGSIAAEYLYSKTCVKRPLKNRQNKDLNDKSKLNEGQSIAFYNTFDLHSAITGIKNLFSIFLRVAVLHRFYCSFSVSK